MIAIRLLILTSLISLLTACGFHLKGQHSTEKSIHAIYLASEEPAAVSNLKAQLQNQGITLADSPDGILSVTISDVQHKIFDTAIGDKDRSKEVELTDSFLTTVERDGKRLGSQRIQSSTYVQYNSDTYLGSSAEAAEARTRLMRDNADKLIRYINSLNDS